MVRTRSQLENLSKKEIIDEGLSLELNDCFNDFEARYQMVAGLPISKRL